MVGIEILYFGEVTIILQIASNTFNSDRLVTKLTEIYFWMQFGTETGQRSL
jgi:hypothetical protein